jgi:hypothetical protein
MTEPEWLDEEIVVPRPGDEWATDGKPYGTIRWFGKTWDAPVNDPVNNVKVPVGKPCIICGVDMTPDDQGVTLPYWDGTHLPTTILYHLHCWFDQLGVPH